MKSSEPIRASSKGKLDLDAAFRVGGVGTAVVAVTGDDIARRGCRSPDGVVGRARLDGHAVKKVAQLVAVVGDTVRVGDPPGNIGAYEVAPHRVARGIDAQEDAILPIVDDESLYRAVVGLDLESV